MLFAQIFYRRCESDNVMYNGDMRCTCRECGDSFDVYDGKIDIVRKVHRSEIIGTIAVVSCIVIMLAIIFIKARG